MSRVAINTHAGLCAHLTRLQSQLNESTALEHAKLYGEAITEFRALYTEEVVETVRKHGIAVTHDYKHRAGAIPLPVTLSMLLGMRIGELGSGAQTTSIFSAAVLFRLILLPAGLDFENGTSAAPSFCPTMPISG